LRERAAAVVMRQNRDPRVSSVWRSEYEQEWMGGAQSE